MKKTDYIKTFVLVAVVLFCALQKGYGSVVFPFLVFIFVVTMLYNLIRMALKPDERKKRCIRIAIWSVTVALIGGVLIHRDTAARNEAEVIITKVLAYKAGTGSYPAGLKEAGLDERALRDKWGIGYYVREGKIVLYYSANLMPLTTYDYYFETRKWQVNAY